MKELHIEVQEDGSRGYTNERAVKEHYEAWKSGNITLQDYGTFMCKNLENFIKQMIQKNHVLRNPSDFEDFLQEGFMAVYKHLEKYDPYTASPTSYFMGRILEALRGGVSDITGRKEHYQTSATRMGKILREYGYTGFDDDRLTADMISVITGYPLSTVVETQKELAGSNASSFDLHENEYINEFHADPLDILVKAEADKIAVEAYETLTALEQFCLKKTELADPRKKTRTKKSDIEKQDERLSKKELAALLKTPEARRIFGDELPRRVDATEVQIIINRSVRKLRGSKSLMKYNPDMWRRMTHIEGYEQASVEDIDDAISAGLLDDSDDL